MFVAEMVFMIVLGAILGSFANVLVVRLHEESSILGRSRCPGCRQTIKAAHLVPIVSWFYLRGKCAACGKGIHWQYPVVEASVAILTLVAFLRHATEPLEAVWPVIGFEILLSIILIVIVTFDLRWQLIPLEFTVVGTMLLAAYKIALGSDFLSLLMGAVAVAAILGAFVLLSRGRLMGEGDPIVGMIVGIVLGFPYAVVGLLLAFISGGAVAAALLLQGSVTRKTAIPFTPFLFVGMLIAIWWAGPLAILFGYAPS